MFSYEELLSEYNNLIKENHNLKNEVHELKLKLGIPVETEEKLTTKTIGTGINKLQMRKFYCFVLCFVVEKMFLQDDGIAKQQKNTVISPYAKTNGQMACVINENTNVHRVQTANCLQLQTKIYTNILKERIFTAEM